MEISEQETVRTRTGEGKCDVGEKKVTKQIDERTLILELINGCSKLGLTFETGRKRAKWDKSGDRLMASVFKEEGEERKEEEEAKEGGTGDDRSCESERKGDGINNKCIFGIGV